MSTNQEGNFAPPSSEVEPAGAAQPISLVAKAALGLVALSLLWLVAIFPAMWQLVNTGLLSVLFLMSVVALIACLSLGAASLVWRSRKSAILFGTAVPFAVYPATKFPVLALFAAAIIALGAAVVAGRELRKPPRPLSEA